MLEPIAELEYPVDQLRLNKALDLMTYRTPDDIAKGLKTWNNLL